jgi:glycine cleavage system transcriptional repressor
MSEREYLILSAIERDRPGLVAELTGFVAERGCNVEDSRVAVLGGHAGLLFLLSGSAEQVEAVERDLKHFERASGMRAVARRIVEREAPSPVLPSPEPFIVTASAIDHVGLIHAVADTVRANGGNILELETTTESAPMTGAPLFALRMRITLPDRHASAARLRAALEALGREGAMDVGMVEESKERRSVGSGR